MIYKQHPKEHITINKEDYKDRPHAYEAACINSEIENMCSSGEWYDEETGKHLFTEVCTFIPASGYYDNGQGDFVSTYTAHFPLKEGQTAEQAFKELQGDVYKQMFLEKEAGERAEIIEELPIHVRERLAIDIICIKNQAALELKLRIKEVEEKAIETVKQHRIAIKQAAEYRKNDLKWHAVCQAARTLVVSHQKDQAKLLVQNYLSAQKSR